MFWPTLEKNFWMPGQGSTLAADIDNLFFFILWINIIFSFLNLGLMIYFAFKYRAGKNIGGIGRGPSHSTALELLWSVPPLFICMIIFYWGWKGYVHMYYPPTNAYEIQVEGYKWGWNFTYPNGISVGNELVVPKDVPVRLVMTSKDVIHSLYIPEFRTKKDVVPGRFNKMWFEAVKVGDYRLYCTEYCGTNHSQMIGWVRVKEMADFNDWMAKAAEPTSQDGYTPISYGRKLWQSKGCNQCHSLDGVAGTGPTWKNIWGAEHEFTDGTKAIVDENYVVESIKYPGKHIVKGYGNVMPSYEGSMKDRDIRDIIALLKSISENNKDPEDVINAAVLKKHLEEKAAKELK
jgi:cytochrome c oxidase subunit 2